MYSEFNSVYSMSGAQVDAMLSICNQASQLHASPTTDFCAGMCYLKFRLYEKALQCFESAINADLNNSDAYFFTAVSELNGKKPFVHKRDTIANIEYLIKAAIAIEPKGIYYYFWGYIKYDYFERKYLNSIPTYKECLTKSEEHRVTALDKKMLFDILGVDKPIDF